MRKISAEIVADSVSPQGHRITTYLLTYPRMIHAEVMTHRMFSRNAASSRAIPFERMVESVKTDPFIPIAFQKSHKGMQGSEYLEGESLKYAISGWLSAKDAAVKAAQNLANTDTTKQLCNRILEPFLWYTNLVTATEYDNFFELRCPQYRIGDEVFKSKRDAIQATIDCGDGTPMYIEHEGATYLGGMRPPEEYWRDNNESHAEIHIQVLAEAMWDARNESWPKTLRAGEWHIPFSFRMDLSSSKLDKFKYEDRALTDEELNALKLKIATARCARLSYETHDGEIDYEKDIKMHDTLLERKHASCFEHCAKAMSNDEADRFTITIPSKNPLVDRSGENGWCRNLRGFIPYRHIVGL